MHYRANVGTPSALSSKREAVRTAYLVEYTISTVVCHLEGNIGSVLDTRDTRCCWLDTDAPRGTVSLEVTDDELVSTGRGVEVVEGRRGGRGRDQHAN